MSVPQNWCCTVWCRLLPRLSQTDFAQFDIQLNCEIVIVYRCLNKNHTFTQICGIKTLTFSCNIDQLSTQSPTCTHSETQIQNQTVSCPLSLPPVSLLTFFSGFILNSPCALPSQLDSFCCNYHTPGSTCFLPDSPVSPYKPKHPAVQ